MHSPHIMRKKVASLTSQMFLSAWHLQAKVFCSVSPTWSEGLSQWQPDTTLYLLGYAGASRSAVGNAQVLRSCGCSVLYVLSLHKEHNLRHLVDIFKQNAFQHSDGRTVPDGEIRLVCAFSFCQLMLKNVMQEVGDCHLQWIAVCGNFTDRRIYFLCT